MRFFVKLYKDKNEIPALFASQQGNAIETDT